MVASACVLPQEPFPVASLDYSHKRHNSLSSLHNWNRNSNTGPKTKNATANYTSLSSYSISSSSHHSPKSVASITPSMSPSSIISSQRANRQEKKHRTIHSAGAPSGKGLNRSALVYTSSQPEPPSPSSPSSQSRSGAQGTTTKSLKRFSVWASSVRQALSSSSSSHPIHGSCKSTTTPPSPLRPKSTASTIKSEYSNHQNFNNNHNLEGTEPLTNVTSTKSTATSSSFSSSSPSSPPLLYSSSFEPRGPRLLSQGTRRKIGAGLITAFCIAAIVLLVLC